MDDKGVETESSGKLVQLKSGVAFEMPEKLVQIYLLCEYKSTNTDAEAGTKVFKTGEDEKGAWAIRDNQGKTVLWLRFGIEKGETLEAGLR